MWTTLGLIFGTFLLAFTTFCITNSVNDYKNHRKYWARGMINGYDKCVTMTFEEWEKYYRADPNNWQQRVIGDDDDDSSVTAPVYIVRKEATLGSRETCYQVIFKTHRDYNKYVKFINDLEEKNNELKNTETMLELSQIIRKKAAEEVERAEKELEEKMKAAATWSTSIPHYTVGVSTRTWPIDP